MSTELRVAFPLVGGRRWTGGYNYLLNLCRVLNAHGSGRVKPVVFVGTDIPSEDVAPFQQLGLSVIGSVLFNNGRKNRTLASAIFLGFDPAVEGILGENRIDLMFEVACFFGWRSRVPALAWFPDFQHRRLRHNFGMLRYWRRELGFRAQIRSGRMVMLSSQDAAKDCTELYRIPAERVVVIPFAVMPPAFVAAADVGAVPRKYGLPERFFYLPNQFLTHKNHALVIEALALLKQRGSALVVAASGAKGDSRAPNHYEWLVRRVRELGLEKEFRFLGMIPYHDVVSLMCMCIAVVNPSLFEGWSSTVEEAKSLGLALVLSDLAVHREQAPARAIFFDPTRADLLASALTQAESRFARRPSEPKVSEETTRRLREFAARFEALAIQSAARRVEARGMVGA